MIKRLTSLSKIGAVYRHSCTIAYEFFLRFSLRSANSALVLAGGFVLVSGFTSLAFAEGDASGMGKYTTACNYLLELIEGPFGALLTAGAGIGAIVASALGGFKMAWTLVVVAVGAFILRGYLTLFFAACQTSS